ncbi:hypothetical protein UFOVP212_23 [uncultured Caudovirales phage]|uniref:Uncharacterized protein n=1 Tax=uncultured Caudovirales phage TaxID=2100421 RepID=A0A6J7WKQ8_9CAUD|nr:hypothetical protein UFOVP212_23 [uncultured Caudovirales phage]
MLNINLNLPTLPTQDQKDAMDGANTPDATNVFVTANDLSIPTLQEVTDAGATTTNTITIGNLTTEFSQLLPTAIGSENAVSGTYAYLDSTGILGLSNGVVESDLRNTDVTNAGVILEFPNKPTGSYTIATTDDIPTPTMQVNSDWNAISGVEEILNKPSIPAAQIQSDWNQTNSALLDYIKNKPTVGSGDMTKAVYDTDNSGIVDNAEAIIIIGRNSTGVTLRKGTIVYISGSTGNRPNFVKAQANSEATSAGTFGVIVNDIANNADGNCCTLGYLDTLDTRTTATYPFTSDTLADGDTIYLSPTTAGYITNVKPSAPNHLVYIGKVTRTSPTNGTIVYRIQNGYELEELHNVAISSVADNNLLTYENSTSLWKNKTASALGIAELASPTFTGTLTSPAIVVSSETANTIASFDASKNVKSLSTATYPTLTELSYVKGVTSAIQTQLNTKGFTLQGGWGTTNPADATTYYAGSIAAALVTTSNNMLGFHIPKNCTLKSAYINIICNAATTEAVTYNAYIGGTASLITTNNTSSTSYTISATGLSIACTAGQLVLLQIVTPTWATNPTSQRGSYTFYFE